MTPLAQDVKNIMDSLSNLALLYMAYPTTKLGKDLQSRIFLEFETRINAKIAAEAKVKLLEAEVEGLRYQNSQLTEALLAKESSIP